MIWLKGVASRAKNNLNLVMIGNKTLSLAGRLETAHDLFPFSSGPMQANDCRAVDHRFIKNLTKHMKGFKSFNSASATLEGIEVAHMIHKQQFGASGQSAFQQFAALAG